MSKISSCINFLVLVHKKHKFFDFVEFHYQFIYLFIYFYSNIARCYWSLGIVLIPGLLQHISMLKLTCVCTSWMSIFSIIITFYNVEDADSIFFSLLECWRNTMRPLLRQCLSKRLPCLHYSRQLTCFSALV